MKKLKIGVVAVVLVAGFVALVVQLQTNTKLRAENASLRQASDDAVRLREENERLAKAAAEVTALRQEHAELVALRGSVATLQAQVRAATRASSPAAGKDAPPGRMIAIADMTNQGRATPRATGQTLGWAIHHGEIDIAASLLAFGPEAREKMEALIATLPDDLRSQYGTPEKLMAFVMAGTPRPIESFQVLDEAEQGPEDYLEHVQLHYEDGRTRVDPIHFHLTADGWQQVIGPTTVDRVVNYLNSGAVPPPVVKK